MAPTYACSNGCGRAAMPGHDLCAYCDEAALGDVLECPDCHGSGSVTYPGHSVNPSSGTLVRDPQCDRDETCGRCAGAGAVRWS